MCCSGDRTAKATEVAQAAFTNTLQGSFNQAFAANQAILGNLTKTLTDAVNNPKGFDPKTLALMKTNVSDTVAQQTQSAQAQAGNYNASHGGADLGSGVAAQISGQIAGQGAMTRSNELNNVDIQNGVLQNQNYWNAISGLTNVAQAYNPQGYAGQATGAANSVANLSQAVLASQQAGWKDAFGVVSGISGLASAAMGLPGLGGGGATSTFTPQVGNGATPGFSANPSEGYT